MDFLISNNGELLKENNKLSICEDETIKVQSAYCICKSISNDWFIDKLGANLEQLIGKPNNKYTKELAEKLIITSISDLYDSSSVYVETIQEENIMTCTVYLKSEDGFTSNKFNVIIDLLGYSKRVNGG